MSVSSRSGSFCSKEVVTPQDDSENPKSVKDEGLSSFFPRTSAGLNSGIVTPRSRAGVLCDGNYELSSRASSSSLSQGYELGIVGGGR